MAFEARFDFDEVEEILKRWRSRSASQKASIMQVVAEMLRSAVDDRYASEGDGEWPPHALSTIRKVGAHNLLQLTGVLAGSTDVRHGPDFAEATTSVSYVVYHLDGGAVIPKRNPFELNDDVFDEIEDFVADALLKKVFT